MGCLRTCAGTFTVEQCCPFSHSDYSPLLSLTMHSTGDGICSLPCIVPRRGHEAAAASHTRQPNITSSTHMKSVCYCFILTIGSFSFAWFYAYFKVMLPLSIQKDLKISQKKKRKMFFKVEKLEQWKQTK